MVKINEPTTLARFGVFKGDLGEVVKKFSEESVYHPAKSDINMYTIFKECEEPYLLMLSQQKDKKIDAGFNTILTVTSYSNTKNLEVVKKFEKETNFKLNVSVSPFPEYIQFVSEFFLYIERTSQKEIEFWENFRF